MKGKTAIGAALDAAGAKAQYDGHVKRILGSRQVLARILKGGGRGIPGVFPGRNCQLD